MTDLKTKIEFKKCIDSYLLELKCLAKYFVRKEELSAVIEVEVIRLKAIELEMLPASKFEIRFDDKKEARFSDFVQRLYQANSGQLYYWTKNTNKCGLFKNGSIKDVDFSFPFDINDEGIVVLLVSDIKDKLILDFSLDASGEKNLEVESQGYSWPNVQY